MTHKRDLEPVNCTASELSTYLAALAEGYCPTCCSDINPSAPSKSMSIASKSWRRGKKTGAFPGFPSLRMSKDSTDTRGEESSISSPEDFPARIFQPPDGVAGSTASVPGYGGRWRELSMKYDRATSSWRTHRSLWDEDLPESSLTLPKWGLMHGGVLWELPISAHPTSGNGAGLWRTPSAREPGLSAERLIPIENGTLGGMNRHFDKHTGRMAQIGLTQQVKLRETWRTSKVAYEAVKILPTPTVQDAKNNGGPAQWRRKSHPMNVIANADSADIYSITTNSENTDVQTVTARDLTIFPTPTATNTKANHMRGADNGKPRESRNYLAKPQARDFRSGQIERFNNPDKQNNLNDQIGG
jgi:hypothetical protein